MKRLVLHPSETAQWQALVSDAQDACTVKLNEDIESYLVFLLMRFAQEPTIASRTMATELLESQDAVGSQKKQALRDVGDQCLLISGLFPGRASKRLVKVSYYVSLGQTAYSVLAGTDQASITDLYGELCIEFVNLMDVLQTTRDLAGNHLDLAPLEAEELWRETKSKRALKALQKYSDGLPIYNSIPDSLKKN